MFTGIVQGTAKVVQIDKKERFQTHVIELDGALIEGLELVRLLRTMAAV